MAESSAVPDQQDKKEKKEHKLLLWIAGAIVSCIILPLIYDTAKARGWLQLLIPASKPVIVTGGFSAAPPWQAAPTDKLAVAALQDQVNQARNRAKTNGADTVFAQDWARAEQLNQAAKDAFTAGDYGTAQQRWGAALSSYSTLAARVQLQAMQQQNQARRASLASAGTAGDNRLRQQAVRLRSMDLARLNGSPPPADFVQGDQAIKAGDDALSHGDYRTGMQSYQDAFGDFQAAFHEAGPAGRAAVQSPSQ